jgi:predicted AAA+ superfamily ATPase
MFRELVNEPQLQIGLVEQPMFMARQKDMFELVQRILSHQSSRLLTLLGVSGIGKSSLVQRTLQHINQRQLLPGGFVVLNIRGVKNCLMLRRAITSKVFEGWAAMVGIEISQDSEAATELILEKLALFNQRLIWVIDDAEDLISADRNSFK